MEEIPDEVKRLIISLVDEREDLKSVRLVSKEYSLLAAKQLFKTVFLHFRESSLENFTRISKQPLLRTLVNIVIYEADGDVRDYWTPLHLSYQLGLVDNSEAPIDFERYLGVAFDESSRLAVSMANLPNVHDIRFQNMNPEDPAYTEPPAPPPIENLWILPRNLRGHGVRSFFAMMRAASLTLSCLRYLEASQLFNGIHYDVLGQLGLDMQHTSKVFQKLRRFIIHVDTRAGENESQHILAKGALGKLLTVATHLEDLSVGFDQRPDIDISLTDLLGSGTWLRLKNFSIIGIDFHLNEMIAFLGRHPNITWIGLSNCKLHSGSIKGLLELLRSDLNLTDVHLDGSIGDQDAEFEFWETSQNRKAGMDFVLGHSPYPEFEPPKIVI